MGLTAEARLLYARHLLLPEIGVEGQVRLSAARFVIPEDADARASTVAREYLERAGLRPGDGAAAIAVPLPQAEEIAARAIVPELEEAEAAIAGAHAAVVVITEALRAERSVSCEDARG